MVIVRRLFLLLIALCIPAQPGAAGEADAVIPAVPTAGMITMVDLGADKCTPCKLMAPILEEVRNEYAGRASIIFIDVWKHRDQVQRFQLRAIPTQIFYDQEGREKHRHVGFMDKKSIVKILRELGVPARDA